MQSKKIVIIGSGPAGYSAAIYGARAGFETVIISGFNVGGQLTITTDVENYPGYVSILGPELMEVMKSQSEHCGVKFLYGQVDKINKEQDKISIYYTHTSGAAQLITADVVIIATGAQAKHLGLDGEKEFLGFGVSMCATCDGPFFRNKKVMVVGGGNTALEEANFLSSIASEVILVHRRDKFRAEKALQDKVLAKKNISILWNTELRDVIGSLDPKYVTGAVVYSDAKELRVECDGIFIAIGHSPSTKFLQDTVMLDDDGYIVVNQHSQYPTMTSVDGVFAAGDVCDRVYRQAVTAAGMGCMALLDAQRWIENNE